MIEIKKIINEIIYIYLNYFVNNIPIWGIRKFLYQLLGLKIGKNSRILMKTVVIFPWRIKIGDNSYINEHCFLDGRGDLKIGSNVTIAIYSKLITGYHDINDPLFSYKQKEIVIGDNCVVFAGCIVLGGVKMQDGALLTAGTVAKAGTYKSNGVYTGNPVQYLHDRKIKKYNVRNTWKPFFR